MGVISLFERQKSVPSEVRIQEIDERHHLAQQVFFRREELGMTQQTLANAAETTQAQIANIEAGHVNPTLKTIVRIAHALRCHVRDLFCPTSGEGEGASRLGEISSVPSTLPR